MADGTKIEWTDATWNPVTGCSVLSPGCTNCYAMRLAGTRMRHHPSRQGLTVPSKAGPVWNGTVRFNEQWLLEPLTWKKPRRIFVVAHGDLFHDSVPDEWINRVFAVMALCPRHQFQVLTKRADRMRDYLTLKSDERDRPTAGFKLGRCDIVWQEAYRVAAQDFGREAAFTEALRVRGMTQDALPWPLANVWLGVSVEDQQRADERIPHLLATRAAVRWLSCEPLLGPIDLQKMMLRRNGERPTELSNRLGDYVQPLVGNFTDSPTIDWVVAGGESGTGARPMHPAWARSLRDQCAAASVPFLFKQWGAYSDAQASGIGGITYSEGSEPGCVAWPDGTVGHGRAEDRGGAGLMLTQWHHKRDAGRLLDGVEHDGFPA